MNRIFKRKKGISCTDSQDLFNSSSDEEYAPAPASQPQEKVSITKGEIYSTYTSFADKPTIIAFVYMILFQILSTKPFPVVPLNVFNEPVRPFTSEELEIKEQLDEATDRLIKAFGKFKRDHINKKSGRKSVSKGGHLENEIFFNLAEDYPMLILEQNPSQGSSISNSQRSTASSLASYLEEEAPKPTRRTKKQFRELCAAWKREKTDEIYQALQKAANSLNSGYNGLLAYLGFRGNYLTNKKVANAFYALSKQELLGNLPYDKALYMKYRYALSKRDWIDFHHDLEDFLQMPSDKALREYEYKLLPDEMLQPFEKGWAMKIKDIIQSTLTRLPKKVKDRSWECIQINLFYFCRSKKN